MSTFPELYTDHESRLIALTSEGGLGAAAVEKVNSTITDTKSIAYAMIDPTLRDVREDPLFIELSSRAKISEPVRLPVRHKNVDERLVPILIPIDVSVASHSLLLRYFFGIGAEDWATDSLNEGLGHRFCGVFISNASIESIAHHFAKQSILNDPRGGKSWIRWFDPAVTDRFWPRLNSGQQSKMLATCTYWVGLGRLCAIACRTNPDSNSNADDLVLDATQWALLDNLSIINTEIVEHEARTSTKVSSEQRGWYEDLVMRAYAMKISEPSDIRTLLRFALRYHPAVDTHMRVAQRLATRARTQTVNQCLAAFSDTDWEEICGELNR